MKVIFPKKTTQRYYDTHYRYVLNVLQYSGGQIEFVDIPSVRDTMFFCEIEGQKVAFDFSDAGLWREDSEIPVFKFHHKTDESYRNVFPFSPVSFFDWDVFFGLRNAVAYNPEGKHKITMRQRPYSNAVERRTKVAARLKMEYGDRVHTVQIPQMEYWEEVEEIRIGVFVPGQSNNMLDRGQFQYISFGAATVSPRLPELLPYRRNLHACYLECDDAYTNLIVTINSADENALRSVGNHARRLFEDTSTPEKLTVWIALCLEEYRGRLRPGRL